MATVNHTGDKRPAYRYCEHQEGDIRLIGLPERLLAKCSCGAYQKIPVESAQRHHAIYCACGAQARLSKEFLNLWTRVRVSNYRPEEQPAT